MSKVIDPRRLPCHQCGQAVRLLFVRRRGGDVWHAVFECRTCRAVQARDTYVRE